MDITKEYIKMCEGAEEIQKEWVPKVGDYFICNNSIELCASYDSTDRQLHVWEFDRVKYREKENCLWLPRQDQLQIMLGIDKGNIFQGLILLQKFIEENAKYQMTVWSMEQLWLAFVMKEKYNKIWNREEWY